MLKNIDPLTFRAFVSFCLALEFGIPAFWFFSDDANPKVPLLAGVIAGFGGAWLVWRIIDAVLASPRLWRALRVEPPSVDR